jgi:hypothetical protein
MKKSILLALTLLFCLNAQADSFLTSTHFCEAYQSKSIIKEAKRLNKLNDQLITFILNKRKPVALKLAIINQLGWNFTDRQKNSELFLDYVISQNIFTDLEDLKANADEEVLISFAYMLAMEDYFEVSDALDLARRAVTMDKQNKKQSYSINLVFALVEAQVQQHEDRWCRAYEKCDAVRANSKLKKDMKKKARKIVFDYVQLYQEYC